MRTSTGNRKGSPLLASLVKGRARSASAKSPRMTDYSIVIFPGVIIASRGPGTKDRVVPEVDALKNYRLPRMFREVEGVLRPGAAR